MRDYLTQEEWWWIFLKQIDCENKPLDLYALSNFHELLGKTEQRKTTGKFFTPKSQIKVTCHYALFFFLRNRRDITLDDETLYQIVFQCKYASNLRRKECSRIAHVLKTIRILDPSCGTGIFLAEMGQLLLSLVVANPINTKISTEDKFKIIRDIYSNLYGYDIDINSVKLAKIILTQQIFKTAHNKIYSEKELRTFLDMEIQVYDKDFLIERNPSQHKFDIIIGNPPYIRHHGLNATSLKGSKNKTKFIQRLQAVFPEISFKWDKKADLYIYFWIEAIANVNEGGIVSFVLSRSWLSSRYTTQLKQVLLSYFNLDLIIELPFEVWKSAEVRTHIVVGHKDKNVPKPKNMILIVWKDSVESLLQVKKTLFGVYDYKTSLPEKGVYKLEIKTMETNHYRLSQISDLTPLLINSKKSFPLLRLDYLTMSPFLINLLIDKRDHFCILKDLGKLEMGSTTGANRFFYLDKEIIEEYEIPKKNLQLMTKSPKEWPTIFSPIKKKLKYLLHIPKKLSEDSSRELQDYINNIQDEILKRPYFKNKTIDNWYQVPLIQPDLLLPNMIFKRSFVAYNRDDLHIDKQWIGFWVNNQDWQFFLLGFLNSTLGVLLREVQGTKTLGLGSLKLSLLESQNLLVLDPRKIPEEMYSRFQSLITRLGKVNIDSINREQNSHSEYFKIQELLDHLIIVECLGLTPTDIARIREILKFEVNWRLAKEKRGNHK
ncbi:MAG: HsdM family class I SAM-dependent methyltransferase [Candidatus Hodarchaeales archaeon]